MIVEDDAKQGGKRGLPQGKSNDRQSVRLAEFYNQWDLARLSYQSDKGPAHQQGDHQHSGQTGNNHVLEITAIGLLA